MQHSYEGLDRPGGFSRVHLFSPLSNRRFRLLWTGMTVSLVGDGVFLVAMAWQAYALWNAPTALAVVGIAMTIPTLVFLLPAGVVTDRVSRRTVMLTADSLRGAGVLTLAALSLTGHLTLWELALISGVYGAGQAFFSPAFDAIVPDLLDSTDLPAANSLDQFVRPITLRLAGPALGGWLIAAAGVGAAFALDATTFAVSAVCLVRMGAVAAPAAADEEEPALAAIRAGLVFVKRRVWLWGTLVSAGLAYLAFLGPTEVLLPYVVKNSLHASPAMLGMVFAAGGIGSIGCALLMGQVGQPRRDITCIYVVWTLATLAVAGYGLATAVWQLMLACLVFNALETAGTIMWATLKQRHVPAEMLGRVSSLDWFISIGLLPLSYALTGPAVAAVGVRATLVGAAAIGGAITLAALFLPHMRDVEREAPLAEPAEAPAVHPLPMSLQHLAERDLAPEVHVIRLGHHAQGSSERVSQ